jgi:hypothetical protein
MRTMLLILGLLAFYGSMPAQAAPKAGRTVAQQAMNECVLMYCGSSRDRSVKQSRPILVEGCFRQKTGHLPAELGIITPSLRCCPGEPCPY